MATHPLTNADRDLVRKDFLDCYAALVEQKDSLLDIGKDGDGDARHKATKRLLETLVSFAGSFAVVPATYPSFTAAHTGTDCSSYG